MAPASPSPAGKTGTLSPTGPCPLAVRPHRPGTQRSGRRCPPIARRLLARAPRRVQAAAAPGWRSAGIRHQRLLLPRRPVPPAPALRWAGEGGRWELTAPAERRFLLPDAEGRRVPERGSCRSLAAAAVGAVPEARQRPTAAKPRAAASSASAPGFPRRLRL